MPAPVIPECNLASFYSNNIGHQQPLGASGAGAASQQAIGTVVFGGMLSSTLLAIPFVPVLYVMTPRLATWATDRSKL